MRDWLPDDHLVYFLLDVVRELDLSAIYATYNGTKGGQPPFDPRMMVGLLLYAYCVGTASSRKIEQATYEEVPFRVLTADQHPDHDTIAEFRRRHLLALSALFLQVLRLCREAGLVRLGHVALDGTKMRANASKHKAMSYGRMDGKIVELEAQIGQIMAEAEALDQAEDARHGTGRRGDEWPQELQFRQRRLEKIRQAKAALETEAKQKAEQIRQEGENRPRPEEGPSPVKQGPAPDPTPPAKAQKNFTDPDSRIMKDGASKAFEQCYNGQAAVDDKAQVIVAADVTQQANDKQQVQPMVLQMKENLGGAVPEAMTADAGYFSEKNVDFLDGQQIDGYLAVDRQKHGPAAPEAIPDDAVEGAKARMLCKLHTPRGRQTYRMRKAIVEPVFGQTKSCRGFRGFLLRGLENVRAEWRLICTGHNLLKLFRSGWAAKLA
jgi:transposase